MYIRRDLWSQHMEKYNCEEGLQAWPVAVETWTLRLSELRDCKAPPQDVSLETAPMVILANCDVLLLRFVSLQVGVVPSFPVKQNSQLGKHIYPVSCTHMYQHLSGDTAACSPQALLHLVPVGPGLGGGPACPRLPVQTARTPQQRREQRAALRALSNVRAWPRVGQASLPG